MSLKLKKDVVKAWDVFELINQGVSIFDQDLRLVFWNDRFLELLEFPHHLAFEGATFESFIRHNATIGEYGDGDVETLVAERVELAKRFEKHRLHRERPDGTVIEVSGSPMPNGGFVSIYTDITLQKKREQELEREALARTRELANSEARLQLIADEVPAGIAHVDGRMNFLFANRRFARAYGHTPDSIAGLNCEQVLHPQTFAESKKFFERARRGKIVDFEMKVRMPKDRIRDVRTYLRPERGEKGDESSFYILSVDVTRNKAATTALLSSQKMDALGRMSSGISHDFNNLLTIILGNLVPLTDRIQDPELLDEYLVPAISAARRGSSLTARLINLARQKPINPQTAAADESLSDLVDLLRSSIPENIDLNVQLNAPEACVSVDASELETAILNLVVNARDAISGSGTITLSTNLYELSDDEATLYRLTQGEYVKITLADTGVGMSVSQTEQVFEPFHTTKADVGGSGLGLAMVYSFVRQSNGTIWVDSELGQGSVFTMMLPTTQDKVEHQAFGHEPYRKLKARKNRPLVLLVEDDRDVRRVVMRQLTDIGFATLEADSASTALDLLELVEDISAVLTDVIMPGKLNGIDLANEVRCTHPNMRVVLMSGNQEEIAQMTFRENTAQLLRKPFSNAELADALSGVSSGLAKRAGDAS
ncbi:PAS sensor protein [Actibacterium atlanticum]|uniref:histidine kinase n=1 Tax=Actibacterium atlanticum TaxID=1461693 RepID=A0A058ZJV3_9RHOB|nr:PAS-domain containing protein [Actibacterium atlanticum]KCV81889.1 PAS sensor protein [Actibacterium atlanticum]